MAGTTSSTYLVKMSLLFPGLTLANFTSSVQLQFRSKIANLTLVSVSMVSISYSYASSRRRLLVAGLDVNVTIQAASSSSASTAVTALNSATQLNSAMAAIGFPNPTVLVSAVQILATAAATPTTTPALSRGGRRSHGATALGLPPLLTVATSLMAAWYWT